MPIPVAMRCKARVYDRSFAWIAVSNPDGSKDICPFESEVDVPASGWSLVQRSATECVCVCVCVIQRDREVPKMRSWPIRGYWAMNEDAI
jgi:hypothetical protein